MDEAARLVLAERERVVAPERDAVRAEQSQQGVQRLGVVHRRLHGLDVRGLLVRRKDDWLTITTDAAGQLAALAPSTAGRLQLLVDGTGHLCFHKKHCERCLVQKHEHTTVYLHQVLEAKVLGPAGLVLSAGTEFIAMPGNVPKPVSFDKKYPYVPNGQNEQPTFRVADLENPILRPWVKDALKRVNDRAISGKDAFPPQVRCWPLGGSRTS